jgi:hypothetical protein
MRTKFLDGSLALSLLLVVVSGFAHTWQQVNAPGNAVNYGPTISMSADGRIICVIASTSRPYISTNWENTWAVSTNTPPYGCYAGGVAISADGSKIIASLATDTNGWQNWVFISTNYGVTWALMNLPGVSNGANGYAVTCSADGEKLVAAAFGGPIYYSTNTGFNWNTSSAPNGNWTHLASSADGQRMVGTAEGDRIFLSTNSGATWVRGNLSAPPGTSVCVSSDGKWVGVAGTNTFISSDGGSHWITNKFGPATIACSADGTNWIIGGPQVYTSTDGGITWITNLSSLSTDYRVAASADFCELVAVTSTGKEIWAGRATPSPQLNIKRQNSAIGLSWLLPSTNFVLQQSSDIAAISWTAVTNNPTLNFTNLQQQVSVPETTTNTFFRLMAQ